jgi:hypothetical protein
MLFAGVDKVLLKDGGVYNGRAMSQKVILTLSTPEKVQEFAQLLEIEEPKAEYYCMCLGDYAIELYTGDKLKDTIGFHHGTSIRYDAWNGDAELLKPDSLVQFLAEQGFTKILQERTERRREAAANEKARQRWLEIAPKCFEKHCQDMLPIFPDHLPQLIHELDNEIPDRQSQIIVLLQTFATTNNLWTGFPIYEAIPKDILASFAIQEIVAAYLNAAKTMDIRKGLGRFLCFHDIKPKRKEYLQFIPWEVIEELEECFDSLGEKRGINEIFSLRNEKNGK